MTYFRDIKPVLKTYLLENVVQRSCCFEGSAEERENKVEIVQKNIFLALQRNALATQADQKFPLNYEIV